MTVLRPRALASLTLAGALGLAAFSHGVVRAADSPAMGSPSSWPARAPLLGGPSGKRAGAGRSEGDHLAFVFDWAPPCRVPVVESVTKKGRTAELSYFIAIRSGKNRNLNVFLEDFAFSKVEGQPISAAQREQLKPVLEMTAALPALEVSRDGHYLKTEGLDEMVRRLTRQLKMPADRAQQLRRLMASPQMAALIQASIGSYWATWVESWIAWDLAPKSSTTSQTSQPLPNGGEVPALLRKEFIGMEGGYASLQQTTTLSGESATRLITSLVNDLTDELGLPGAPKRLLKNGRVEVTLFAETAPATLRPRRTRFDRLQRFELTDGTTRTERELRELTWHWERAEGCGLARH